MAAASSPNTASNASGKLGPRFDRMRRGARRVRARVRRAVSLVVEFWLKITNDWIFNLSAVLAYNLLMSFIPILFVLLAVAGFFLGNITPGGAAKLQRFIAAAFPDQISHTFVEAVAAHLSKSASIFLALGIVSSIFIGSRLFIAMENCFGIVFRLRGRDLLHQNVMAVSMLLLYIGLVPLLFLGSIVPPAILKLVDPAGNSGFGGFLLQAAGVGVAMVVAVVLFGVIYVVVPNRRVNWHESLKGTLVAATLLVLYEVLFPFYVNGILHPGNYGSIAGFILVLLIFFFYLAFILLLGAEVISFSEGQRRAAGDLAAIMHEVQAHRTTVGAAGATAGTPREDVKHGKGMRAMRGQWAARLHERRDHHDDAMPSGKLADE